MDDVSFIFQGQKSQIFSTLGGVNVNMEYEQWRLCCHGKKVVLYKSATLSF